MIQVLLLEGEQNVETKFNMSLLLSKAHGSSNGWEFCTQDRTGQDRTGQGRAGQGRTMSKKLCIFQVSSLL
jgi:hypothetical protein